MDYKYWCKFLSPENLIKWETEIIMTNRLSSLGREDNLVEFNNFDDFIISQGVNPYNSMDNYFLNHSVYNHRRR